MEDLSVQYDLSVRDGRGQIVQCLYNGDGLDATYLENVRGRVVPVHFERAALRFPGLTPIADLRDEVEALAAKILGAAVARDLMQVRKPHKNHLRSQPFRECVVWERAYPPCSATGTLRPLSNETSRTGPSGAFWEPC